MTFEKRGLYRKIIDIILDILIVLFAIILAISIYNNIQIKLLGNKYSSFFGYSTFEVQTGSMADTINVGDWIIVKKSNNIRLDDIVTYEKKGQFITHRVIEAYKGTYITKGDANNSKDEAINQDQIVGKVVKILPGFGIIRKTIFNPIVLVALIITLYLFGYALKGNKKEDESSSDERKGIKSTIDGLLDKLVNKHKELKASTSSAVKEESKKPKTTKMKKEIVEEIEDQDVAEEEFESEEEVEEEVEEEYEEDEDTQIQEPLDLNQTMAFRMVDVDKGDLDSDYLELAKKELEMFDEEVVEEDENVKDTYNETKEKLKIIQNKKKKFKNIIDKVIYTKTCELNEIIDIFNKEEKLKPNEATIKEEILNHYIDGKYYNFCNNVNVEYNNKNMITRLETEIKNKGELLIKQYKGTDAKYQEKVEKYVNIFLLINWLEKIYNSETDVKTKRDGYTTKITKYLKQENMTQLELKNTINKIIKLQNVYQSVYKHLLGETESSTFQLDLYKIVNKKNLFGVYLNHNIAFSKVYSDYIVDKTYSEGIIAEDKTIILLNLVLVELIKDMFRGDFSKKYFIYVPGSVYTKENKLNKIFNMFEDEFVKNNIVVVVEYNDFINNKKVFRNLKKQGYHFALYMEDTTIIKDKDQKSISVVEYVFINKKLSKSNDIISKIPEEVKDNIIYEDILSKINGDGGK